MSELSTGAYAPDSGTSAEPSKAAQVAGQSKEAATQAATEVKDTAKEQAQRVGAATEAQVRTVAADVRDKVTEQARTQNDKLIGTIRQTADHLDEMRGDRQDSPAAAVVSRVADGGRQLADYLDRNGPEGVLREVQDFARRRPGAFLATALAAGFVVGRLGKGVAKADSQTGSSTAGTPQPSATPTPAPGAVTNGTGTGFVATPAAGYPGTAPATAAGYPGTAPATAAGYPGTSTEYAATGTGTPVAMDDPYGYQSSGPRP